MTTNQKKKKINQITMNEQSTMARVILHGFFDVTKFQRYIE